jgi:translation initiation factor IF-2
MTETKQIRIPQAATKFGVGATHIIDFLKEKGFSVSPATKLTDDMYDLLAKEFQQDAALKDKAAHITIGTDRGEKNEIVIDKTITPSKPKEEEVELQIKTSTIQTEVKFEQKEKKKKTETEEEVVKVDSKKVSIKGPKLVGKVDVEEEEETKKKGKTTKTSKKKKQEESVEESIPAVEEDNNQITEEPEKSEEPAFIERKKITLEGVKLMGKIEIKEPEQKQKPEKKEEKSPKEENQKRPRKRILVNKVDVSRDPKRDRFEKRNVPPPLRGKIDQPKEISEKEIQDKIKETQAKLAGLIKGKGSKKYKRKKRGTEEIETADATEKSTILEVTEFIPVSELASLMDVPYTQIISKCMELGVMVSINQRLDAEIIELVASEFGFTVKFVSVEDTDDDIEEIEDDPEDLKDRPPIVTVMGHVDHGKTTLLDFIRKANVAAGEAGGITQHIGAYEVTSETGKKVVFLDTPGHEAFTAMRARGAKITDVAVIVIAADDSVMPQTKEAISHAQAAGVPMVFAINKVDKDGANPEKIREQLSQMNILVEEWGGKYQCQEISAKKGLNIDKLLDKILLEAEMLELKANPDRQATGTVIEATLDKGRGYVATVLVQNGTLEMGDVVIAGTCMGKVKALFSSLNEKLTSTGPASACTILGLDGAPQAGEKFHVLEDESDAKEIINKRKQILREQGIRTKKHITLDEIGRRLALGNFKELNIIIKGDVDGSVEALTDSLLKLSTEEVQVKVVLRGVGQITESDVLLASASDAIIIGFNVRAAAGAKKIAESENIQIKYYSIIYNAIEEIKTAMEGMLEPTIEERITGNAEIREVYKITKVGTVAGCYVSDGKVYRTSKVRVIRDGIVIHTAKLSSLKRFKDEVKEVVSGQECGMYIKDYNNLQIGDVIEAFEELEIKRKL